MSDQGSRLPRLCRLGLRRLGLRGWSLAGASLALTAFFAGEVAAESPPPLRFFPVSAFDGDGDAILSGVRVSRLPDGSVRVARERFESGGGPRGLPVPAALGGGYLFYQPLGSSGGAGTALFRASDWTGPLQPLGTAPFVVSAVRAGFDRYYLLGSGRAMAVDPETGSYLPLDPLPPVATILDLRFDQAGGASLRAPIVGTLTTSDSGLGWRQEPEVSEALTPAADDSAPGLLPRQGRLVQRVVLRGATLPDGMAIALLDGHRVSFSPERGALSRLPEPGLDPRARCQALPPGELSVDQSLLLWFACRSGSGPLVLRAYGLSPKGETRDSPPAQRLTLSKQEVLSAEAIALAAGRLGVLVSGACPGDVLRAPAGARGLCLVSRSGRRTLLAPAVAEASAPETFAVGSNSVSRLSLLPDGGIQSERLDAPGRKTVHRIHHEAEIESLVFGGTWLPGATVFEEGISFWAIRGESYVGIRLERESEAARVGAIQRPVRRAFLSGKYAMAWGASGFARISVDAGMTFAEVSYPFVSGDQDPSSLTSPEQALELGCGPVGCSLGSWISVGWGRALDTELEAAPPRIAVPPLGGGRFRFVCSPAGESSAPGLFTQDRARSSEDASAGSALVPPFWERAPPRSTPVEIVHSVGDHRGLARVYATGPKEAAWGSRGRVLVSFRSPFVAKGLFESLATSDLFRDDADAQTRLGVLDRVTQTSQTELDPGGEGGVMLIRTRQQTTLLSFARHAPVQRFDVPDELGLSALSGAVLVRGRWLLGHAQAGEFRVVELTDGGPSLVASFPLGETGTREAVLTRSTAGDLGIAIDGDLGLLVYPVSRQGQLGDALFQPFRGSRPPQCPAHAAGYLVVRELSIAPYVETQGDEFDVSRVTMRRVVGFGPECIDALAADARGAFPSDLLRPGAALPGGTPLAVADRVETGRRVGFICQ